MKAMEVQSRSAAVTANASALQRKCACGQHTIGGGRCDECRKPKLTVGPADDHFEREADRAADHALAVKPGSRLAVTPVSGQIRRARRPGSEAAGVDLQTEDEIESFRRGGGKPLGGRERRFFEPRFARDFSAVRVHDDDRAASLARKVGADAFTVGHDIFFGSGRHDFARPGGLHLLAHELTHVAQQTAAAADTHTIRRAKISYRALTWADFKKAPPAGSPLEAETSSGFDIPNWRTSQKADETGKGCTIGGKADKEYKATANIDPAIYDAVAAYMDQDQSWVIARRKDGGKKFCTVEMPADCANAFSQAAAQAKTQCAQEADSCRQAFKDGSTSYSLPVGGAVINVTNADDCKKKLAPDCEKELGKTASYSLKDMQGKEYAKASTKAECKDKTFQSSCETREAAESVKLLKHEQGHFDISNVLAPLAKADLKAKAAAFKAEETACSRKAALQAAVAKAAAFGPTLTARGDDWLASKDKAHKDYDDDTDHGKKDAEQATWEAAIKAGLKAYDLNAPKTPAGGATQTPTPNVNPTNPANPPAPKKQSTDGGEE